MLRRHAPQSLRPHAASRITTTASQPVFPASLRPLRRRESAAGAVRLPPPAAPWDKAAELPGRL